LGIIRNNDYAKFVEKIEINLHKNDIVVLYTDGLVEGRSNNSADGQYGYERLKQVVHAHVQESAQVITEAIYQDFTQFTQNNDYKDDTSLVVIKIKQLNTFGKLDAEFNSLKDILD